MEKSKKIQQQANNASSRISISDIAYDVESAKGAEKIEKYNSSTSLALKSENYLDVNDDLLDLILEFNNTFYESLNIENDNVVDEKKIFEQNKIRTALLMRMLGLQNFDGQYCHELEDIFLSMPNDWQQHLIPIPIMFDPIKFMLFVRPIFKSFDAGRKTNLSNMFEYLFSKMYLVESSYTIYADKVKDFVQANLWKDSEKMPEMRKDIHILGISVQRFKAEILKHLIKSNKVNISDIKIAKKKLTMSAVNDFFDKNISFKAFFKEFQQSRLAEFREKYPKKFEQSSNYEKEWKAYFDREKENEAKRKIAQQLEIDKAKAEAEKNAKKLIEEEEQKKKNQQSDKKQKNKKKKKFYNTQKQDQSKNTINFQSPYQEISRNIQEPKILETHEIQEVESVVDTESENVDLKKQLEELQRQLQAVQSELESKNEELDCKKQELQRSQQMHKDVEKKNIELEKRNIELSKRNEVLVKNNGQLKSENINLLNEMQTLKVKNKDLQDNKISMLSENQKLDNINKNLTQKVEYLEGEVDYYETRLAIREKDFKVLCPEEEDMARQKASKEYIEYQQEKYNQYQQQLQEQCNTIFYGQQFMPYVQNLQQPNQNAKIKNQYKSGKFFKR